MANIRGYESNGVEYMYIDKAGREMMAKVENTSTATSAHTTGGYLIYNDKLYEVIADIAVGDTLTVNTNIKEVPGGIANVVATKANVNGTYEDMTVGNTDQLVATVFETDNEPYNFRTSGGTMDIGDREYDQIVGGTIAWNQLVQNGNFDGTTGWSIANDASTTISASGNVLTVTFGASAIAATRLSQSGKDFRKDRVFLAMVDAKSSKALGVQFSYASIADNIRTLTLTPDTWTRYSCVIKMKANGTEISLYGNAGGTAEENDTIQFKNFVVFDLTQMFGVTIANYIYGLEQATAGAGAAWFTKMFPNAYYAYDAGTLMSVKAASHNTVGFNQWDEEWEQGSIDYDTGSPTPLSGAIRSKNYIRVIPNQTYFLRTSVTAIGFLYDIDKNYIGHILGGSISSGYTFTVPENAYYFKFRTSATYGNAYKNDICINLSWSGYRNGEYEPYVKRSYSLDSSLELRGVPNLDASNNLYYSGDTYSSDGVVARKYRVINMGDLTWILNMGTSTKQWLAFITGYEGRENSIGIRDSVCSKIFITDLAKAYAGTGDAPVITVRGNFIVIYNPDWDGKTGPEVKVLLNGIYYVYGLKTPSEEEAEPFQSPQVVDDFGTEEYVDAAASTSTPTRDVAIPVGHVTQYPANLRDKLQHLPSPAQDNGLYIVSQTDEHMTLTPYEPPETVVTVTGSTPTITGVANHRYMCGEVSTLSVTPPVSGMIDVMFTSGSSAAVLTVPNTVKWANGFDSSSLDANTTYELSILDGVWGVAAAWA